MAHVWWGELQREKGQKAEREFAVAAFIITLAIFSIIWIIGGWQMNKTIVGTVDMYGVQYYYEKSQVSEDQKTALFQDALKAGNRKTCYFEAEVTEEVDRQLRALLEVGEYKKAAQELGKNVVRLWLPTGVDWQKTWTEVIGDVP
jgi:hypothetical protein